MPADPHDRRRALVPGALALLALLGVAALASGGRPLGVSRGGHGPSATFVDYAWTTLLIVFALWLALAIWTLFTFGGRLPERDPTRRWWLSIPVYTLFVCLLVLAFHALHPRPHVLYSPAGSRPAPTAGVPSGKPRAGTHDASFRWEELAAVLGSLALLAAVVAARRRGRPHPFRAPRLRAAAGVSAILDEAVDDLRTEPDVRRAIIAAYARTERALAQHGLPRRRSEAPLEYLGRALAELDAGAGPIRRLTDLFERAKFSQHEPDEEMRNEAIDALIAVRDDLRDPLRERVPA